MKFRFLFFFIVDNGIRNGRFYVILIEKIWLDILYEIMFCLVKLGLIMVYIFLCDR